MTGSSYDIIIIGSGVTGLTAARQLARQRVSVATIEGGIFGGLITNVNELDGEFGGSGADLASTLMIEASDLGCATLSETVTDVRRDGSAIVVATDAGEHRARGVIVASGAKLKRLGVPGEAELEYKGVSQCADCDGPMFKGQDVVVVGGGDSALQEALVLSHFCASVRIVHRGAELSAHARWQDAIRSRANISVTPSAEVTAIEGDSGVEAVRLKSVADGSTDVIRSSGVFVYIGLVPSTDFVSQTIERDASGALVTGDTLETAMPGVFAAGAVRAAYGGALADAVNEARVAADAVLGRLAR